MCGIAGLVSFGSPPAERSVVAMTDAIRHRGPDDAGVEVIDGTAALGMRRLSIVDLEGGHQPMWDERRDLLPCLQRGDLQLRRVAREAPGLSATPSPRTTATPRSSSTATRNGDAICSARLNGMFAVAIWDREGATLVVARDRAGEKPLYVARVDGGWALHPRSRRS